VSYTDEKEYSLKDVEADSSNKSDAERERARDLLLVEDALVNSVKGSTLDLISPTVVKKMLQLAVLCEIDIKHASTINNQYEYPLKDLYDADKKFDDPESREARATGLLKQYIDEQQEQFQESDAKSDVAVEKSPNAKRFKTDDTKSEVDPLTEF